MVMTEERVVDAIRRALCNDQPYRQAIRLINAIIGIPVAMGRSQIIEISERREFS
jgi:hypothetical protein